MSACPEAVVTTSLASPARLGLRRALMLLWLACSATAGQAQPTPQTSVDACDAGITTVAFVNGVRNSRLDAEATLRELRRKVLTLPATEQRLRFELLYNPTAGDLGVTDLLETYQQRAPAEFRDRMELFSDLVRTGGRTYPTLIASGFPNLEPLIADFARATARQILEVPDTQAAVADAFRVRLDATLRQGQRLVVVAHSQGNLFARPLVQYFEGRYPDGRISYVQVAPPNANVTGAYMLANEDLVINLGLRAIAQNVASPNLFIASCLSSSPCNRGFSGHGFVEIYLNDALTQTEAPRKNLGRVFDDLMLQALNDARPVQSSCPVLPSLMLQFTGFAATQTAAAYDNPDLCGSRRLLSSFVIASDSNANDGGTFYASGCYQDAFTFSDGMYYQFNRQGPTPSTAGYALIAFGTSSNSPISPDESFYFTYEDRLAPDFVRVTYRRGSTNFYDGTTVTGPPLSQFVAHEDRLQEALAVMGSMRCDRSSSLRLAGMATPLQMFRGAVLLQDNGDLAVRGYVMEGLGLREIEAVMFTRDELRSLADEAFSEIGDVFGAPTDLRPLVALTAHSAESVDNQFVRYLNFFSRARNLKGSGTEMLAWRNDRVPLPLQDVVTLFKCTLQ